MTVEGTASVVPPTGTPEAGQESKETVSYEAHRKMLDDVKKMKAKIADYEELQSKFQSLEDEKRQREEDLARKRGDFDKILKAREDELAKERQARLSIENQITLARKQNAVVEALGGSVERKWLGVINLDKIAIDPNSGDVDQMSVSNLVEELKTEWPEMLRKPGSLPQNAPQGVAGGPGKIAESAFKKLPSKEQMKYKPDSIVWGS